MVTLAAPKTIKAAIDRTESHILDVKNGQFTAWTWGKAMKPAQVNEYVEEEYRRLRALQHLLAVAESTVNVARVSIA